MEERHAAGHERSERDACKEQCTKKIRGDHDWSTGKAINPDAGNLARQRRRDKVHPCDERGLFGRDSESDDCEQREGCTRDERPERGGGLRRHQDADITANGGANPCTLHGDPTPLLHSCSVHSSYVRCAWKQAPRFTATAWRKGPHQ